uniref:type II toxin-antitoxin system RelE/ParE family toxin n=1 Tax=Acetatifactor sp. TaxID=1872090 RepID=UPI004056C1C1
MKQIDITPRAHEDLADLKAYLLIEFGETCAQRVLGAIYDDIEKLAVFPELGVNILAKHGIVSDYLCLVSHKNCVFYRIEGEFIRVIRVLDERRDYLHVLFGISTSSEESEEYWDEV